jgi:hypothetical protein
MVTFGFHARALGHDFAELVYMDTFQMPALKKMPQNVSKPILIP